MIRVFMDGHELRQIAPATVIVENAENGESRRIFGLDLSESTAPSILFAARRTWNKA
jgi:hypothetical protein